MTITQLNEHRKANALNQLLDVYIQDPMKNCGYLMTAETLYTHYFITESNSAHQDCITFIIPDENALTDNVTNLQSQGNSDEKNLNLCS